MDKNEDTSKKEVKVLEDVYYESMSSLFENVCEEIERVYEKINLDLDKEEFKFDIFSCLMTKNQLKFYNEYFSPVFYEDYINNYLPIEDIEFKINDMEKLILKSVPVIMENHLLYKKLETKDFNGEIIAENEKIKFKFRFIKSKKYNELPKDMYQTLYLNKKKYKNINIPYLNYMYDIQIQEYEDFLYLDKIKDIILDYGEFKEYIKEDHYLVWNIKKTEIETETVIRPFYNEIMYEKHSDFHMKEANSYMIYNRDINYFSLYSTEEGKMIFLTNNMSRNKWLIYEITDYYDVYEEKLDYMIYNNKRTKNNLNPMESEIKTRTYQEVQEYINSYTAAKGLIVSRILTLESDIKEKLKNEIDLYPYNIGVEDQFSAKNNKCKEIILFFSYQESNKGLFLKELISFITAELELRYREIKVRVVME